MNCLDLGFMLLKLWCSKNGVLLSFDSPEKLEMNQGMLLEQVKRKIPAVLFAWDTYSASREGQ